MIWLFVIVICIITILLRFYLKNSTMCNCPEKMSGKTVLITGGSRGIGYQIAKNLARRGARIIITSENISECQKASLDIIKQTGKTQIFAKHLDYTSLQNVRNFVTNFLKTEQRLDILINNACNAGYGPNYTKDGILIGLQVNYLGPFLLTNLLIGLMKTSGPARIINVSSKAYLYAYYKKDNINAINDLMLKFDSVVYNNSKLFLFYMTWYMAKALKPSEITVNILHPGCVNTTLLQKFLVDISMKKFLWKYVISHVIQFVGFKSPEEGAQTSIHLAVSSGVKNVTGEYFVECRPAVVFLKKDFDVVNQIWDQSVRLVGLSNDEMFI